MIIRLNSTGTFAKPSAEVDYQLTPESSPDIPPAVTKAVADWLQIIISANVQVATGLQQINDHWWLIRTQMESSTDAANRQRGIAFFGRLETELDGQTAVDLIYEFCRMRLTRQKPTPDEINVELSPESLSTIETVAATLLLAIGLNGVKARKLTDAKSMLDTIPLTEMAWIFFFPYKGPLAVPSGRGLLINEDADSDQKSIKALINKVDAISILRLPLAGLLLLPDSWEVKLQLVESALGELTTLSRDEMSVDAFWWLANASVAGRDRAVHMVDGTIVADWLASSVAQADDLMILKPYLTEANQDACTRLAQSSPNSFRIYANVFPNDLFRLWPLLPTQMQWIGSSLRNPSTILPADNVDQYLRCIAGTGFERMGTDDLANAVRSGSQLALDKFAFWLEESGLDQAVVSGLLLCHQFELPEDPPRLSPSQEWIAGIDGERWLSLGRIFMQKPSWRRWWVSGLGFHFQRGRLDPEQLISEGIANRQPDVLKQAGANDVICALVQVNSPRVKLMETASSWDRRYNRLIDLMFADFTLFDRIDDPLNDDLAKFISTCLSAENKACLEMLCRQLCSNECVEHSSLLRLSHLLTRRQRFFQLGAWYQSPAGQERNTTLSQLIESGTRQLRRDEISFFQTVMFTCHPMPQMPEWTAVELGTMLPLVGPLAIIRQIMIRREPDKEEQRDERVLLDLVLRHMSAHPIHVPLPRPSVTECQRRPDWYESLRKLISDWRIESGSDSPDFE